MVAEPEFGRATDYIWCCNALDLLRALPECSVDLTVTSPPYDKLRQYNGYSFDFEPIAHELYRVTKTGGVVVWVVSHATVGGSETLASFRQAIYFKDQVGFNVHDTMIWAKKSASPNLSPRYPDGFEYMFVLSKGRPVSVNLQEKPNKLAGQTTSGGRRQRNSEINAYSRDKVKMVVRESSPYLNVWEIDSGFNKTTKDIIAYQHPAMFPEELARRHILSWSSPGDLVLDPFMGSGTVAKVARNLDRHYIGCDISAEYVTIARERLANTDPFQSTEVAPGVVQRSLFGLQE